MKAEPIWLLMQDVKRSAFVPAPVLEFPFHPERKWRFDAAWPEWRVAVEIEGGVWKIGRHQRPRGFQADLDKYNYAAIAGWWVLRFSVQDVEEGIAIAGIEAVFRRLHGEKTQALSALRPGDAGERPTD